MSETTALTRFTAQRAEAAPVPATIDQAMRVGELMAMFDPDGTKANAVAKVLAGQELGIGPMAAIRGIHMIKGKPSLSAELVATLIKRSGRYDFRAKVEPDRATVTVFDRGEALEPVTFTLEDAKRAGLIAGNVNYNKFPGEMCFTKALIRAARWHCPEVIGGAVYMEDGEAPAPAAAYDVDGGTGEVYDAPAAQLISEPQRRRLFAIAAERGIDRDRLKMIVEEETGQDSTTAITVDQYDALVAAIENPPPVPGQQTIDGGES